VPDARRPSFGPTLSVGDTLLLVAGLVLGFVPHMDCPRCTTWNFFGPFEIWDVHEFSKACRVCSGRRSVSLFAK
jgi:hypothetical protein